MADQLPNNKVCQCLLETVLQDVFLVRSDLDSKKTSDVTEGFHQVI